LMCRRRLLRSSTRTPPCPCLRWPRHTQMQQRWPRHLQMQQLTTTEASCRLQQ
jgi:hypothetical protein